MINNVSLWGGVDTLHHDQTPSVQAAFAKDVCSLVNVIDNFGHPFEEEVLISLSLTPKRSHATQLWRLLTM